LQFILFKIFSILETLKLMNARETNYASLNVEILIPRLSLKISHFAAGQNIKTKLFS